MWILFVLLVAVTNALETRSNLRQILGIFLFLDLTDPRHVFTSELTVMNMVTGLLGSVAKYPYFINWQLNIFLFILITSF